MARRPGRDVYRVSVRGVGRVAAEFDRKQRALQDVLIAEVRQLGRRSTELLQEVAPRDTDDLHDAIEAIPYFRASSPRVSVRVAPLLGHQGDELDPYDYLDVTRRGHRSRRLRPVAARALKVHIAGHRNPAVFVFRSSVKGLQRGSQRDRPQTGDWVESAEPLLRREQEQSATRLGRQIRARVL